MTGSSDESVQNELRKLQREVDEANDHPAAREPAEQHAAHFVVTFFRLSLFGMMCLGLGLWVGSSTSRLIQTPKSLSNNQMVSAQEGWRAEGSGVFYRWCQGECHVPRLYGGGVIQVLEVNCADRPCGEISMRFNVLDKTGQPIDSFTLKGNGLQGELRRFIVESQHPDAASIEMSDFKARARVE